MERRTILTATLLVVLCLSITSVYVSPASAVIEPVEIWKRFMDTSDEPPYELRTEYHWDIEIGVRTSVDLTKATVSDRFGAELKIDSVKTPGETYTFTYPDYGEKYPTKQAKVTISGVGTFDLDRGGVTFGTKPYKFHIYWSGKSHKIHLEWHIGSIDADTTITIIVRVSTDLNPGSQQEYTSPCEHCINSGAVLTARWENRKRSIGTPRLCVKVKCPAQLILDKFNDTNGNGIYDAGDVKIAGWQIDVTDPHAVTTTYLTPKTVEITEFGTYTITEDLPIGWEQTAVRVDGTYISPVTKTVTVTINEGETHDVLYGNKIVPTKARLIVEKFNDTDGNEIFDGSDVMITGWEVYVTDPHAVTTPYSTPVDLEITEFGTYLIREDLWDGWEQTALFVDDVAQTPTLEVAVDINAGEVRKVLYGNHKIPSPPPSIRIGLGIKPLGDIPVCTTVTFRWSIVEDPPDQTVPQKVTLSLTKDGGAPVILYEGFDFPKDFTGELTWHAENPGNYVIRVRYDYLYLGKPYWSSATQGFTVIP